jgi:MFS family permease
MGDLVPENSRGNYFGSRNRICGLATFLSLLCAGFVLQAFNSGKTNEYLGFVLIFSVALVARLFSSFFLSKKFEPHYTHGKEAQFSFKDFIRQSHSTHIGLLVFYLCFTSFSVMLAGPFFAAYMLYDLKMDYLTYTVITSIALIVKYLLMPMWGNLSDKYGTKKILSLSGFFLCILPILWLLSKEIIVLVFAQFVSGFIWAGFEIASFNSLFDATSPKNRATCVAYYNVLNGSAILAGSLLGGVIAQANNVFWSRYLLVFLLSGILRLIFSIFYIPKLKEVREVEHISYRRLILRVISTMTTGGLAYGLSILKKKNRKIH